MVFHAWKHLCGTKRHGLTAEWVRVTWVCKTWREVALEAAALWSSVLVSRRLADDPAFKMHLDRARDVALDMSILCRKISKEELEEAFSFVLSRTESVTQLQITYGGGQRTIVKQFVKAVGVEVVSLSLSDFSYDDDCEWAFSPGILPRLRHLTLDRIVPTPDAPLLTLIRLEITYAYDDAELQAESTALGHRLATRLHRFLAACPNLETLRTERCFVSPTGDGSQPVALPNLHYLFMSEDVFYLHETLGVLRLQPSASFHITADGGGCTDGDMTSLILPRNVSEALPPIRHTRCLSLAVGQAPPRHLVLRGSSSDTFEDDSHASWSITIPDLTCTFEAGAITHYFPDLELAKLFYLGFNGERFLAHIPDLVVPSQLVELQLHFAQGLPVTRNWSRFFAAMPHLRTLGVGGYALVKEVLKALPVDQRLCGELQNLTLCAAMGPVTDELRLFRFFWVVVGGWVRERATRSAETKLASLTLTVRIPTNGVVSHAHNNDVDGGLPEPNAADDDGARPGADVAPAAFWPGWRRDLAWLEDLVGKLVVENVDCPACGMEYDLPPNPDGSTDENSEDSDEESDEPYFY